MDQRVHGVGADGALEKLVHATPRRDDANRADGGLGVGGRVGGGGGDEDPAVRVEGEVDIVRIHVGVGQQEALNAVHVHGARPDARLSPPTNSSARSELRHVAQGVGTGGGGVAEGPAGKVREPAYRSGDWGGGGGVLDLD